MKVKKLRDHAYLDGVRFRSWYVTGNTGAIFHVLVTSRPDYSPCPSVRHCGTGEDVPFDSPLFQSILDACLNSEPEGIHYAFSC